MKSTNLGVVNNNNQVVRLKVLTAARKKMTVFWEVEQCLIELRGFQIGDSWV
jgi:hypothetical protein